MHLSRRAKVALSLQPKILGPAEVWVWTLAIRANGCSKLCHLVLMALRDGDQWHCTGRMPFCTLHIFNIPPKWRGR